MKDKRCKDYVGLACVDGSCPIANREGYIERGMDATSSCEDCFYYKGCEDCALSGTEYCTKSDNRTKTAQQTPELTKGRSGQP